VGTEGDVRERHRAKWAGEGEAPSWWPSYWNSINPEEYRVKLAEASEADLRKRVNETIWLSAYAGNNPKSDYHWMCDAAYAECQKRGRGDIYKDEHGKLLAGARGEA
jgi:hypothetical protein